MMPARVPIVGREAVYLTEPIADWNPATGLDIVGIFRAWSTLLVKKAGTHNG